MTGLLARGVAYNGTDGFRGVQAALGEVVAWRTLIWAMTTAMAADPQLDRAVPSSPKRVRGRDAHLRHVRVAGGQGESSKTFWAALR